MSARRDNGREALVGAAVRGWRVVVTGGAGFLGSHLCTRLLDEGAVVVALGTHKGLGMARATGARFTERPVDGPQVRRSDTTVAQRELGWRAQVPLRDGLERTVAWFRTHLDVVTERPADLRARAVERGRV